MNKVTHTEIIDHLSKYGQKHLFHIDEIKNMATSGYGDFYISEDERSFITAFALFDEEANFEIELSSDDDIIFFHNIVTSLAKKENRITTARKDLYTNKKFVSLFGNLSCTLGQPKYVAFKPHIIGETGDNIRELTIDDEHHVTAFENKLSTHLRKHGYEKFLVKKTQIGVIYGYFVDGELCSYLMADSIDDDFWHVGFIHTLHECRGQGMGTALANHFLNQMVSKGKIAAYGHADNEASKRATLRAGFVPCNEDIYCVCWTNPK